MFLNEKPENIVFHYNKKHNEDSSISPWIIKFKGKTYYVYHMDILSGVGFSTKETPDNSHTKGSLKIKGRLRLYEKDSKLFAEIS